MTDRRNQSQVEGEQVNNVPVSPRPDSSRNKNGYIAGGVVAVLACAGLGYAAWVNRDNILPAQPEAQPTQDVLGTVLPIVNGAINQVGTEYAQTAQAIGTANAPAKPENTTLPTPSPTIEASETLEPTVTMTSTPAVVQLFEGCEAIQVVSELFPQNANGNILRNSEFYGWNTVPGALLDANNDFNFTDAEKNDVRFGVQCWFSRISNGVADGLIKKHEVVTFDNMAEMMGNDVKDLINKPALWLSHLHDQQLETNPVMADYILSTEKAVAVVTSGRNAGHTVVRMSERLVAYARNIVGPEGNVVSDDAVALKLANYLTLKKLWNPADAKMDDELLNVCLRYSAASLDPELPRSEQEETWLRYRLLESVQPGEEIYVNGVLVSSNQHTLDFVYRVGTTEDIDKALQILEDNDHEALKIVLGDGVAALFQAYDMTGILPENQEVIDQAVDRDGIGSGNKIEQCDVVEAAPTKGAVQKTQVPGSTVTPENPGATATVGNTDTAEPTSSQPTSTTTPVEITATNTNTPDVPTSTATRTPTATAVPTSTSAPSQVPQYTATLGATSTLIPATPSWTPLSPTPPATAMPSHTPQPSPSPVG